MTGFFLQSLLWICAVGSAVVGGVFFAFSTFVLPALARLPPAHGLAAMQAINRSVLASLFLPVFLATAGAALVVGIAAGMQRGPGALPALLGAILFFAGSFAVTAAANVPLNDSIAGLEPAHASSAELWGGYQRAWMAWNHLRTVASLLAMVCFVWTLRLLAQTEVRP